MESAAQMVADAAARHFEQRRCCHAFRHTCTTKFGYFLHALIMLSRALTVALSYFSDNVRLSTSLLSSINLVCKTLTCPSLPKPGKWHKSNYHFCT